MQKNMESNMEPRAAMQGSCVDDEGFGLLPQKGQSTSAENGNDMEAGAISEFIHSGGRGGTKRKW